MASGLTSPYLLPYPLQTDAVDVASDIQALAEVVDTQLYLKSDIESPTFTGNPAAPTKTSSDNSTSLATTAFVKNQGYLTTSSASSTYAPIASPTFTGTVSAPTPLLGDNTTKVATTAFIVEALNSFVTLPAQSDPATVGQFLVSDGTDASWSSIAISDVTDLQAQLDSKAPLNMEFVSKTISSNFLAGDIGKQVEASSSSEIVLTVPVDPTTPTFPIGTVIVVVQTGTGQLSINPDSGVTINATPGLKLRTQWSVATLTKRAANTWLLAGDLVA